MTKFPIPELHKSIFEVRYKPSLSFYQRFYSAAQKLDRYTDWETDSLKIHLRDHSTHSSISIEFNRVCHEQDSDSEQNETSAIEELETLTDALEVDEYVRLGFRRQYLISFNGEFRSLVGLMNVKFHSDSPDLPKILPGKVSDIMYRVDTMLDDLRAHITIGPVQKLEISRHLGVSKYHFNPKDADQAIGRIIDSYPNVAVFLDIDLYKGDESIPKKSLKSFYAAMLKQFKLTSDGLVKYLSNENIR